MTLQTEAGWLIERRGKLTASRMKDAMAFLKTGKEAEARYKYKIDLVGERSCEYAVSHYVTPAMQRGLDYEPEARDAYEAHTGTLALPAALVDHPTIDLFAATPDGFLPDGGLLEIKVPLVTTFIGWKLKGVVPEEHHPQLLAQLSCTRRTWTHFVAYCPEMPQDKRLFIRKFEPTAEQIHAVEEAARTFLAEVDAMFELFNTTKEAA